MKDNGISRLGLYFILLIGSGCMMQTKDDYRWLEAIEDDRSMDWVRSQNQRTKGELEAHPAFTKFFGQAEAILGAKDRIPYGTLVDGYVYNFWQDAHHVRGILRRSPVDTYRVGQPTWTTILDVDALSKAEAKNWTYVGAVHGRNGRNRALIRLSEGGKDAAVYREYDVEKRQFVEDGFKIPEAKSSVSWLSEDMLLVTSDFGNGTLTKSGYPRQARVLARGASFDTAKLVFEGQTTDVGVWAGGRYKYEAAGHKGNVSFIVRAPTFFTTEIAVLLENEAFRLQLPKSIEFQGLFGHHVLLQLRDDWQLSSKTLVAGSLVRLRLQDAIDGRYADVETLWAPSEASSLRGVALTRDRLYLSVLEDVQSKLFWLPENASGVEAGQQVAIEPMRNLTIVSSHPNESEVLLNVEGFTTPDTLMSLTVSTEEPTKVFTLPERFSALGTRVEQRFAVSKDGTKVPYFLVMPNGYTADGTTPTLLYGYGGFEISLTPRYRSLFGRLWLENGGAYAIANIRGGGEYGPQWHQAALKENRQRAFDDFNAVAEDLFSTKVTQSKHLGIMGGSNGGLLVGATMTQNPQNFGAVVCQVPLLDMLRYSKLLAGASWVGEYGDPDDAAMREVLSGYSPFHNVREGITYPPVLFVTSTKDDRVHPGHARKMAKKMLDRNQRVLYFENIDGGHAAGVNVSHRVKRTAYEFTHLARELGLTLSSD